MAFFDDNEIGSLGTVHIEAAEGYSGTIGAQLAMVEGFQNDMAMFTAALKTDMKETRMVREGAGESEILAVQEGALSSFWEKIKAFIKKIIAKVKSVFQGFIAKFEAWMNRDGRAFYNKYKKEIFSGKDLDGLKVSYSKPTGVSGLDINVGKISLEKTLGEVEHSDLVEKYLGDMSTPSVKASAKEFRKEFHDKCFDDLETGHEVKSGSVADYVSFISGKNDPIEKIRKMAAAQEKALGVCLKQVEKFQSNATNYAVDPTKNTSNRVGTQMSGTNTNGQAPTGTSSFVGNAEGHQKSAAAMQKQVSAMQEALGVANSAALTEIKFAVAQSRRIAAAIVAFNPKKNEDTLLLDVEQESAEYEVLSDLESV